MTGGAPCAVAVKAAPYTSTEIKPKGLGGACLSTQGYGHGVCGAFLGPRIHRQWTMAKDTSDSTTCQALPFLLDISLALYDTLDLIKSSVDSEVVFQATLQVPAHHSLACKLQAYGTPFAAPDLQAAAGDLADADLEFAACIAAPPDLDEQMSMNIGRVLSMLKHNRGGQVQAGQVARGASQAQQQQAPSGGGATTAAQQVRAGNVQQQAAPKVLVSVDDAEAGSAQLQRNSSAKKGPRFLALDTGFGKRAMQALLGFGYLLTVLHEKHWGGHVKFTASALMAAAASTPAMANSHMRHPPSFSSSGGSKGRTGMLAGLQKAIQECPSLLPGSFTPVRRSAAGPAPAAAAPNPSQLLAGNNSSSANGNSPGVLLQQQQLQQAGPFAGVSAGSSSLDSNTSFEVVWERINTPTQGSAGSRGAVHGLSLQLSLSAPLGTPCSSSLARVLEEELDQAGTAAARGPAADATKECRSLGSVSRWSTAAGTADAAAVSLSKEAVRGRSGNVERLLEEALQQLAEVDPAAVGLTPAAAAGQGGTAAAAAVGGAGEGQQLLQSRGSTADGKGPIESPFTSYQNLQLQEAELEAGVSEADTLRSHYLPDQGCLTSPFPASCTSKRAAAAAWGSLPPTPNRPPPGPLSSSTAAAAAAAAAAASRMGGASSGGSSSVTPGGSPQASNGSYAAAADAAGSPLVPRSPTILRPMMSMRLTCQPKWQFNEALLHLPNSSSNGGSGTASSSKAAEAAATAAAAAAAGSCSPDASHTPLPHQQQQGEAQTAQQQQRKAVNVHNGDAGNEELVPSGLWPTLSFGLVPVRIQPSRDNQQQQPAYARGRA